MGRFEIAHLTNRRTTNPYGGEAISDDQGGHTHECSHLTPATADFEARVQGHENILERGPAGNGRTRLKLGHNHGNLGLRPIGCRRQFRDPPRCEAETGSSLGKH